VNWKVRRKVRHIQQSCQVWSATGTKAENAILSWAALSRPGAEFYIQAYIRQLKFYTEEEK